MLKDNRPYYYFFIIFFICLNVNAQSGYTLLDSCIEIQDSYDTVIDRTILITTNNGSFKLTEQFTSWNSTWDTTDYSVYTLYSFYNIYDSLNRLTETIQMLDSANQWQFYSRSMFHYDSLGRIKDSIQQYYSGSSWIDTLEWKWQKDSSGKFIFNESRYQSAGQWLNIQRQEWYYDNLQRDTLQVIYQGNGSQWLPLQELHKKYGAMGLVDSFQIGYAGSTPYNNFRVQFFYQALDQDTMQIIFAGNLNQWDTTTIIKRTFDASGNVIIQSTLNHNGTNWINGTRIFFTYDNLNRIIIELVEESDSLGVWVPISRDSTYYDTFGNINLTYFQWNGNFWECSEFKNLEYYNPTSFREVIGMMDPSSCTIAGYYSDIIYTYDSDGRLIYREYDGHAGSSMGYQTFLYDSSGFLYRYNRFSSTMGGLTTEENCVHYKPLLFMFDQYNFNVCNGDSVNVVSHPQGGAYILSNQWKFNNQPLSDTTSALLIAAPNISGLYSMTVTDTAGNYYSDSIVIEIHPLPFLGNDTTICLINNLILNPGSFSSYTWDDGSTGQSLTAFSSIPDTLLYWVNVMDSSGCSNTDSVTIVFDVCQEINAVSNKFLNIYPNPALTTLCLTTPGMENIQSISVINSLGEKIKINNIEAESGGNLLLNISNLPAGIYFVEIADADQKLVSKFIKY
ncbi:MAG TPA: T9SS type A sorting domain-containing protein [Bacteroidia bacterium]|nr:T9SS type A sorting domain-containing protein [Bacteroidia bacterium]